MNTAQTSPGKSQKTLWFFACIAILGLGFASFVLLRALKTEPEQRDQSVLIPVVETIPLEYRQSPLLVKGNGIVSPRAEIGLSSQVTGEVISIHPNLLTGGSFEQGEIMVQIDPRSFGANLAEAEASRAANVSNLNFINKQIERLLSLRKEGYTPEESLDDAINRRDQTLANIARQDAVIDIRRLDLERASLKAPFTGRVLSKNVDVGDIVSPGRELARFYASDAVEILVSLNAKDASFIPGLWNPNSNSQRHAWVTVNYAGQLYEWEGYLDRVEADIDQITRTVDVVVRVPEPFLPGRLIGDSNPVVIEAPPLLIGMYSTITIEGLSLANHFVLPISAVRNNSSIWIVESEGRLRIETVELVREEGNLAILLAPQLAPGTQIIISDIALVSDGMRVRPQETGE